MDTLRYRTIVADAWLTIHEGDCREVMAAMESTSVHCVVTSPPWPTLP